MKEMKVGIIGGRGKMGSWFARLLENSGVSVICSGHRTGPSPERVAGRCDVAVVSVPIRHTVEVIRRAGPLVPENGLMMDLTSIKKEPVQAMLEYCRSEVVGLHPLFGPESFGEEDLKVAVCPARGEKWLPWITDILVRNGLKPEFLDTREHDALMGLIQGVHHFSTLVLAHCINNSEQALDTIERFSTAGFRDRLLRIRDMAHQQPGLFGSLLMENSDARRLIRNYLERADFLARIIHDRDRSGFEEFFRSIDGTFNKTGFHCDETGMD